MYLCNCNGLTERQVRELAAGGIGLAAKLFRCLDCRPQCGKCLPEIRSLLGAARAGSRRAVLREGTHERRQGGSGPAE